MSNGGALTANAGSFGATHPFLMLDLTGLVLHI